MASRADPIIYTLILMFGSNYKKNVSKNEKFICKKLKYEYQEYHKKELSFFMQELVQKQELVHYPETAKFSPPYMAKCLHK